MQQPPLEPGVHALARMIASVLGDWQRPHVELAIYQTDDPRQIAQALDVTCLRELGASIARPRFYEASIGAVAGVELEDGRAVVIKAHQPDWPHERLQEIVRLQRHISQQLGWAPDVLAGPVALGAGLAVIEPLLQRGEWLDPHQAEGRRAYARSLHVLSDRLSAFAPDSRLPGLLITSATDRLWPTPHSRLFDFEATHAGAADIDALAREARARMLPVGRVVLGHGDWRPQHVRFDAAEPVLAFDWDSLCRDYEPLLVGFTAHCFCADWSGAVRRDHPQAPSLDEARAFVDDYERARGCAFTTAERAAVGGCFAYSVAYTARCGHALGSDERNRQGHSSICSPAAAIACSGCSARRRAGGCDAHAPTRLAPTPSPAGSLV